jgi:hypothetical protein
MNPIVLGALISAGPVLVASALGTWATVRTARVSIDQTELTLAADHARWLRDKQSDVYVEMIRFVQDATMQRADVIRDFEFDQRLPEHIHETIASYEGQSLRELLVQAQAYASRNVGEAFRQATDADLAVWRGLAVAVEIEGPVVLSADLSQAVELANSLANDLYQAVYADLASVSLKTLRQQRQERLPNQPRPGRPSSPTVGQRV